jgi:hypothetical protein
MGSWALPTTAIKARKLKKLLQTPLSPKSAESEVWGILGDDLLFDDISLCRPNEDVRKIVKLYLRRYYVGYLKRPQDFYEKFTPAALKIIAEILSTRQRKAVKLKKYEYWK